MCKAAPCTPLFASLGLLRPRPSWLTVARCAPRVAGAPHGRGLRPEKVAYFVGTDEQAAVVHSRRQRGRASSSTEKPIHGGPNSVIREFPTAKCAAQTAANDAMPRAAGGRKSCSSGALPTGKCECRLASSDEAPAEGVKVGEVRCASSRRVLSSTYCSCDDQASIL